MSRMQERSRQLITALDAGAASLGPVLLQIQAEQARRASMAQTETLISHNRDGILVVDDQDRIVFANPAAREVFGRSYDDLKGMPFGTPSLGSGIAEIEILNAETGKSRINEIRVVDIDWDGRGARLVSLRDVSDRLETQRAVEEHQAVLRERIKELRCLYTVSEYLSRPGVEWQRVLRYIADGIPAGWRHPERTWARLRLEGRETTTANFRETDWVLSRDIMADGEVVGGIEVFCDAANGDGNHGPFLDEESILLEELARRIGQAVSARRYQQQLDASRRRFQDFAEASSDWLWEMDENLRFTYFSDRIWVVMGQPPDHWIGRSRPELTSDQDTSDDPRLAAHIEDLEVRRPFRNFRYDISLPDGSTRHIAISGMPVFDESGAFIGYRGSGTDVTAQVDAENRARELDHRLQGIADRLPGVVYQRLRAPDGRVEYPYLSAGISALLGVSIGEIQNDPLMWTKCVHPDDLSRFKLELSNSGNTLEPMDLQYRVSTRTGEQRWLWHRSTPRRRANGDIVWDCIDLDITDQ
jgi:PAS domain S-box-containing protein